ncbi:MAG: hypothetical protein NC336_01495 [Clostridium sp.]|nr:hypothetical protein [Clostridium sp.]
MAKFRYIAVALSEQNNRSRSTILTYGDAASDPSWQDTFPDAGQIFDFFLNARECYVQWTTQQGNFFSLIFRNPFASDGGLCMLTVMVEKGAALTGRQTLRALTSLRRKTIEEKQRSEAAVDDALSDAGVPVEPESFDSWRIDPTWHMKEHAAACYRTFVSVQELESFFTFPRQQEYEPYSRVIYVAATTSLRPGVNLAHIIQPLRNLYTIETPAGVESSRPAASSGDRIMLTYTREEFSPVREAIVIGRPSMFVVYDGARIRVRSAAECQIAFTRRIPLKVTSARGGNISGYTVSVNGRPVSTVEPYLEISEQDLRSSAPVSIVVSSTNFEPLKIERRADELRTDTPVECVLQPVEQGITLRLDFGEGRIFELTMSLAKNTPEYSQLHSGQFHGFRAHRLTVPGRGEIYNVDVRAAGKPVAPAFDNVAGQRQPEAPKIERAATATETPADKPAEEPQKKRHVDHAAAAEGARRRERRWNNMIGMICGFILLIVVIACAIIYFFPSFASLDFNRNRPSDVATTGDTTLVAVEAVTLIPVDSVAPVAEAETQTQPPVVMIPAADTGLVAYLNRTKVWDCDSLSLYPGGETLREAFSKGDLNALASHPYFATPGACTNPEAEKLIDMLWASYTSPTERSNQRCVSRMAAKGQIDLHELFEESARFQASEKNTLPRPGKN